MMNVGVMSVSRSVNEVSAIPAVNSNRDIIDYPRNSRVRPMFHEKGYAHHVINVQLVAQK